MAHDATKVLLGTSQSSIKEVVSHAGTIAAGTAVRLKSDDTLSVTKSDGQLIGVSLGIDMADTARTAIAVSGLRIPILLTAGLTPTIGAAVWIDDVTGLANIVDDGGVTTTVSNAYYVTSTLTGINESGAEVDIALINMVGGL